MSRTKKKPEEEKPNARDLFHATLALPPNSYPQRRSVMNLAGTNTEYAVAASLGMCVRGMGRFRIPWRGNAVAYAEAVLNELYEREQKGTLFGQSVTLVLWGPVDEDGPGLKAYNLITESLTSGAEVEAVKENS